MIISIVVTLIILVFSYFLCIKFYNKCENQFEKTFYILFVAMETFVAVLYYLDRYNVPTFLGWGQNVDTQSWLSILSGFGINVIVEILGGVILFFVTIMQVNKTLDDNKSRYIEEKRINNLPLLKYSFYDEDNNIEPKVLETNITDGSLNNLVLGIKNIGMNTVRKCYICINSKILKKTFCFELEQQSSLEKNEEKIVSFLLYLTPNQYDFTFKIYYQDLTFNWYMQKVELKYELLTILDNSFKYISNKKIKVFDEEILKMQPNLKVDN